MRVPRNIGVLGRLASEKCFRRKIPLVPRQCSLLSTTTDISGTPRVAVHQEKAERTASSSVIGGSVKKEKPVKVEACGDVGDVDDDEMEQEEMFVDPHESFEFPTREWGGPRRGGRFPEPTRYGDWERKGRCSDF